MGPDRRRGRSSELVESEGSRGSIEDGRRSSELKPRGEKGQLRSGPGTRKRAQGRGVRRSQCGPERPLGGRSVSHSPLPIPSNNNPPHPEPQQPYPSRASTTLPIPGINNSPPPPIRAEIAPVTPSVPLPNRGADRETRACAENAGKSSRKTWLVESAVEDIRETELGVEGRVAEWSRDAEEGSGARVRQSQCGPEAPLGETQRQPFPSPYPEQQEPSPSRASTIPPPIRAEIAPVTPSVPLPNRGADRETRACAEHAGGSSPATPGARSQARYADIAASPPLRHEGAGKTPSVSWTWPLIQVPRAFGPRTCLPPCL